MSAMFGRWRPTREGLLPTVSLDVYPFLCSPLHPLFISEINTQAKGLTPLLPIAMGLDELSFGSILGGVCD